MRRLHRSMLSLTGIGAVLLALSGCGTSATPEPTVTPVPLAVADRPQGGGPADTQGGGPAQMLGSDAGLLALGTLYLEDTDYAVTKEQAATLLPLWQEAQAQSSAESASLDEMEAVVEAIRAQMTEDQLAAIEGLDQGSAAMQELLEAVGVTMPTGMPEDGQRDGEQRQGTPGAEGQMPEGTPPAQREMPQGTRGAQDGGPGGGQPGGGGGRGMLSGAALEQVIALLQARAEGG